VNQQLLELALKKQRLQFQSDALREKWCGHVAGLRPVFGVADHIHSGFVWVRRHPALLVGAGVAIAVARPRATWRWLRRGTVAWQFWRNGQRWLDSHGVTRPDKRT
jgi:hypothetical protein